MTLFLPPKQATWKHPPFFTESIFESPFLPPLFFVEMMPVQPIAEAALMGVPFFLPPLPFLVLFADSELGLRIIMAVTPSYRLSGEPPLLRMARWCQ